MEPGRSFSSPATSVLVQAIYDADSIAVLVRWHDRTAEKTGQNDPTLPVPPEEEVVSPAAAAAATGGNPFGEAEVAPAAAQAARRTRSPTRQGQPRPPPSSPTPWRSRFRPKCRPAPASRTSSSATAGARLTSGSSIWPAPSRSCSPARAARSLTAGDAAGLTGVASYDQGEWSVIFKRPRRPAAGAAFTPGTFLPIAFSVWDGFSRERGNRRGLTLWKSIYLEPENVPSPAGPMLTTALSLIGIELAVIGWVRWRRAREREELGGEQGPQPATNA